MAYIKNEWNLETFHKGDEEFITGLNHLEDGVEQAGGGSSYAAGEGINISNNVISVDEAVRNGAALGATAIQEHQDISGKLDILPKVDDPTDPGFGWEYHIPYRFDFSTDAEKLNIKLYTLTLDNKLIKMQFDSSVPSATSTSAGLMSAADKLKLNAAIAAEAPDDDGTYVLKCVVSGGVKTYNWVRE